MPTRRTFIQSGIAATTALVTPLGTLTAEAAAGGISGHAARGGQWGSIAVPFVFIYDRDFSGGEAFAAAVDRYGHRVEAVGADIGRVWRDTLEPRFRRAPAAIAGLTAGAPLFCLELLARDYGLATAYRVEHSRLPDGRYRHTHEGALPRIEQTTANHRWIGQMGTLVATSFAERGRFAPLELLDLAERPGRPGRPSRPSCPNRKETLFTWMLAPR